MSLTPGVILPCYGPARHAQVSTSWNITWHQMVSSDTKLDHFLYKLERLFIGVLEGIFSIFCRCKLIVPCLDVFSIETH